MKALRASKNPCKMFQLDNEDNVITETTKAEDLGHGYYGVNHGAISKPIHDE